jgi:hypothetical protein
MRESEKFKSIRNEGAKEMAFLEQGTSGVEKRPTSRLIWNEVDKGSVLYTGDIIRTSDVANGTLKLIESGVKIRLEPESVVVLTQSKGSSTIDLMSGSLFVDAKGAKTGKNSPKIKSGKTEIKIDKNDTQLNLSKNKDDSLNMTVTKGTVEVAVAGKVKSVEEGNSGTLDDKKGFSESGIIQALSPAPNASINLNKTKGSSVFRWQKLNSETKVHVEIGPSKSSLSRASGSVDGDKAALRTKVPKGEFYWRLVGTISGGKTIESFVYNAKGGTFVAPQVIVPSPNQSFALSGDQFVVVPLSWTQPGDVSSVRVEVSGSKSFGNKVFSKELVQQTETQVELKKVGTYYFRVIGMIPGTKDQLKSKVVGFNVTKAIELKPPSLVEPVLNATLPFAQVKSQGVTFSWSDADGAEKYFLTLKRSGKKVFKKSVQDSSFTTKLKPGKYAWNVQTIGKGKQKSKISKSHRFQVQKLRKLRWLTSKTEFKSEDGKSIASLRWQGNSQVKSWHFRLATTTSGLDSANPITLKGTKVNQKLPGEGVYFVQVEGLDESGGVIGKTNTLKITSKKEDLLAAPKILNSGSLKATASRSFKLRWSRVKKAQRYQIEIVHAQSGVKSRYSSKNLNFNLSGLLPGSYSVQVVAVDKNKKSGKSGSPITVSVPNKSNLAAPDAQLIKVNQ